MKEVRVNRKAAGRIRQAVADHESALTRLQALEELIESDQRIGILEGTAMSITHLDRFFEAVLHEAVRTLSVRRCSLMLERNQSLVIVASVGLPKHTIGKQVALDSSIAGWVFTHGLAVTDKTVPPELARVPRVGQYATPSFISQIIKHGERCIGVLNVSDRHDAGEFTPTDEQDVIEVALQLALVLTRVVGAAAATDPQLGSLPA